MRRRGLLFYIVMLVCIASFVCCGDDGTGGSDAGSDLGDGSDLSTTGTDSADDSTDMDGGDGSTASDENDGNDLEDGTDGIDATDVTIDAPTVNQLVPEKIASLSTPTMYPYVLAAEGNHVNWCEGDILYRQVSSDATVEATPLPGACMALALDGDIPIVVTTDGSWIRDPRGETVVIEGPTARRLRIFDGAILAVLESGQLASAPTDLSLQPEVIALPEDNIRDVLIIDNDFVVALGTGGVKRYTADGVTVGSFPTGPAMANSLARTNDGFILAAIAGDGLSLLDSDSLQKLGHTKIRGVALDVIAGQGDLSSFALVSGWGRAELVNVSDAQNISSVVREDFRLSSDAARILSVAQTTTGFAAYGLNHVTRLTPEIGEPVPQLYIDKLRRRLDISPDFGSGAVGILVFNDGDVELTLTGFRATSDRLTISELPETIGPKAVEFMQVDVAGAAPLVATFSFDTNDPDNATVEYSVEVNPNLLQVGDVAPDFLVPTTAGGFSTLAAVAGTVTYLKFFNAL